jgi:hypothetical protein
MGMRRREAVKRWEDGGRDWAELLDFDRQD